MRILLLLFSVACAFAQKPSWSPRLIKGEGIVGAKLFLVIPDAGSANQVLVADYKFDGDGKVISEFRPNAVGRNSSAYDYSRALSYDNGKLSQVVERGAETIACIYHYNGSKDLQVCSGLDGKRRTLILTERDAKGKALNVRNLKAIEPIGHFVYQEQDWVYKTGESQCRTSERECKATDEQLKVLQTSVDLDEIASVVDAMKTNVVKPSVYGDKWEDRYLTDQRGNVIGHWSGADKLGENRFEYDANGLLQKMFIWVVDTWDEITFVYEKR